MAIKEITAKTVGKKKSGWRFDKKRELFVTWMVDTTFDGSRHVRRGFLTERAASDYLDQLKVQDRLKQIGVVELIKYPTVKKLFDIHRSKLESGKARSSARRVFDKFITLLPKNTTLDELKRKHFKDFIEQRIGDGIKPESANREMTMISAAIHKAGDYFAELENWQMPKIYRPPISDAGRSRVITKDERGKLLEFLLRDKKPSEREKDFIARRRTGLLLYFGLLTGLRHGEICGLRKTDFDGEKRRLKAERFKTKRKGVSETIFEPLTDTQMWVLSEAGKIYPDGDFFFSAAGKRHNKVYTILKNACLKLAIPYGANAPNGFVIHDTRHSFVSSLIEGGVDIATAKSLSGHTTGDMLMRYAHSTADSRAKAMQLIEREVGAPDHSREEEFREFYISARSGKMSFKQFAKTVESFSGYLAQTQEIDVADVANVIDDDSDFVQ